jgi:hypothetical protein
MINQCLTFIIRAITKELSAIMRRGVGKCDRNDKNTFVKDKETNPVITEE